MAELRALARQQPRQPFSSLDVAGAAARLRNGTGLGPDFLQPLLLKTLGDPEALEGLTALVNQIDDACFLPWQACASFVCLLGKPAGGVRPIALLSMLYRIWVKC